MQGSPLRLPTMKHRTGQRGAAALEFALLFAIIFGVFYGTMAFGFHIFVQQAMNYAAGEGARAAMRVDPLQFDATSDYHTAAETMAGNAITTNLAWMPQAVQTHLATTYSWDEASTFVDDGVGGQVELKNQILKISMTFDSEAAAIFPAVSFIPSPPPQLIAQATVQSLP